MSKRQTIFRNILNYLMIIGIWIICGVIHYFLASFGALSVDFRDWPPDARWIFAGAGIAAMGLSHLLYAAELFEWWKEIKETESKEE